MSRRARSWRSGLVLAAVLLALVAGLALPTSPLAAAQAGTPVRIGTIGIVPDAPVYLATDRGYFAEQGISPVIERFDSAGQMVAPMGAGQLDAGAGSPSAGLFNAIARGVDLRIVAENARVAPGRSHLALVARTELLDGGRLNDYADLRGRSVAMPLRGTGTEIQLDRAVQRGGLSLADVDVRELSFADMTPALANGSVDLAITLEPFLTLGQNRGVFGVFRYVGDFYPDHQVAVLLYAPRFAENTDLARRFMVAYLRGLRDYDDAFSRNRGRAEVVEVLTRNTVVRDAALYATMIPHSVDRNGAVNRETLASDLDWYAARGYLQGERPDINRVIDTSFVDYAVSVLGRE